MLNTLSRPDRARVIRRLTAVAALALVATGCHPGVWGLRGSYRNYVASPIAHGSIEVGDGAVWTDGPGFGRGPFSFPVASSSFDHTTNTGEVVLGGTVSTKAHENADLGGYVLDLTLSNLRLEIADTTGTLYADLDFRPFESTNPTELPPRQSVEGPRSPPSISPTSTGRRRPAAITSSPRPRPSASRRPWS